MPVRERTRSFSKKFAGHGDVCAYMVHLGVVYSMSQMLNNGV